MRDFYLDRKNRNVYVRTMLRILVEKYHVDKTELARAMGIAPTYIYDFINGRRSLLHTNLDKIEIFINDLYEPIIRDEIELNKHFFDGLSKNSVER